MNALAHWQDAVAAAIDSGEPPAELRALGASAGDLAVARGAEIYRNNSRGAREQALPEVFPVCRQLIGERSFAGLTREYVRRHPSHHPDLNRFGDRFPHWISDVVRQQPVLAGLPWLSDLVLLEWLAHDLYYRDDDQPVDLGVLQSCAPERIDIAPANSIAWLRSRWPVDRIWRMHQPGGRLDAIDVAPTRVSLLLQRRDFRAEVLSVDPDLLDLLDACSPRCSLAELVNRNELAVERLGELMGKGWIHVCQSVPHDIRS